MAQIPTYEAPDRQLTASDKGASAFEQAGRRTGPAYNEAATLTKQAGEAEASSIKMRKWAFDMLDLEKSIELPKGLRQMPAKQTGVEFKVEGGGGSGSGGGKGGGGGGSGGGHDGGARGKVAAGLSQIGAAMARGNQYRSQTIDTASGLDINDPKLAPKRYSKTLEGGKLVTYDRITGQTSKAKPGPNDGAEKEANLAGKWTPEQWQEKGLAGDRAAYLKKYGYDPATGQTENRDTQERDANGNMQPGTGGRDAGTRPGGRDYSGREDPWNYDRSLLPNSPSLSRDMEQSMAPGAANDVAREVGDMNETFNTGPNNGGGEDPDSSGTNFGAGGDEGGGGGYSDTSSDFGVGGGGGDYGGGGDEE